VRASCSHFVYLEMSESSECEVGSGGECEILALFNPSIAREEEEFEEENIKVKNSIKDTHVMVSMSDNNSASTIIVAVCM